MSLSVKCERCTRENCQLPRDKYDGHNICLDCRKVILRKFSDAMLGYYDAAELAVIDEALDGRYMVDVVGETQREVERHAS